MELKLLLLKLPKIKKLIETRIKKKHNIISFFEFLKKNTAGTVNKEIQIKLKEQVPMTERICIKYKLSEKLNEIRFQGKPVNIKPLMNSIVPNRIEKIKNELAIFFE